MKKSDFVTHIAQKLELPKAQASQQLNTILESMMGVFIAQDSLTLPGFFTMGVKKRLARSGHNPSTGKPIHIPEAVVPFVRVSARVKTLINSDSSAKTGKANKNPRAQKKK